MTQSYRIVDSTGLVYIGSRHGEPQFDDAASMHARVWRCRISVERARDYLANLCQEEMLIVELPG